MVGRLELIFLPFFVCPTFCPPDRGKIKVDICVNLGVHYESFTE